MKVSEKWLRDWVNPNINTAELGELLTFAGVELDGIEPVAYDFTSVVIGQIISVEQHPDADRLKVCKVDVAQDEALQIVTNVADVAAGQKVPVAMIGANLPDAEGKPFKIKKGKLRGVLSQGMFCGGDTLGMPDGNEGLLGLPDDAPVGEAIRDYLDLDDIVYDFDITPNRADCNSIMGIAREVGVLTDSEVKQWDVKPVAAQHQDVIPVSLSAPEGCRRYAGRLIHGVNPAIPTPLWMKEKLRRAGVRSLSFLVDVTNYVLMELGQPMHAFDAATLEGGVQARFATAGEKLTLLDGQCIELDAESLVIADDSRAVALAGIMGGLDTSVTDNTTDIFLESAFFAPEIIAGKARSYGLHTDSSYRFERGVSPDLQVTALERATDLVVSIAGGQPGPVIDVMADDSVQQKKTIALRRSRIERLLGIAIDDDIVERILIALGCSIENSAEGWVVEAPLFRFDMAIEVDLIEELARVHGYDKVPSRLRSLKPVMTLPTEKTVTSDQLCSVLVERGYQETVSYSFVPKSIEQLLSGSEEVVELLNPLSADLSVMRSTLWAGLVQSASYNLKRQQSRFSLFETGLTFVQTDDGLVQRKKMAGLIAGNRVSEQWSSKSSPVDFFDIKGDVECLLATGSGEAQFVAAEHAALHPGQSAKVELNGEHCGWMGMLHPSLEKQLGLSKSVFLFELDMMMLGKGVLPAYEGISAYPSVQRDIALSVPKSITYNKIDKIIKKCEILQLVDYHLFDNYEGEGVAMGRKSLAINLIFQDSSRTLEDAEITALIERITAALNTGAEAMLRD